MRTVHASTVPVIFGAFGASPADPASGISPTMRATMNPDTLHPPLQALAAAFAPPEPGTPARALRAVINVGNPVLAQRTADGRARGVSVDLAQELARRLGLGLELLVVEQAADSVEAVASARADVGFFAIDPKRGEKIAFAPAYVHIEGWYLVRADSALTAVAQVDRAGQRVVVGQGSAYDLFLSRELRAAEIIRVGGSAAVIEHFLRDGYEVAAGVKQQLVADLAAHGSREPRLRLLPERFMVIRQAMGCPKARGEAVAQALAAFVEDVKRSGFVAEALARHGQTGASVAPAGE